MAEKRSIEGYTYQQERTLDVAEAMAGSGGAGALGSMGMELGIMTGVSRAGGPGNGLCPAHACIPATGDGPAPGGASGRSGRRGRCLLR